MGRPVCLVLSERTAKSFSAWDWIRNPDLDIQFQTRQTFFTYSGCDHCRFFLHYSCSIYSYFSSFRVSTSDCRARDWAYSLIECRRTVREQERPGRQLRNPGLIASPASDRTQEIPLLHHRFRFTPTTRCACSTTPPLHYSTTPLLHPPHAPLSLPLNTSRRLGRNIIKHPVHSGDFIEDAI